MLPILQAFIANRRKAVPVTDKEAASMTMALSELNQFMFINGEAAKDRQKLLRNFSVIDILVEMVQTPFSASNPNRLTLSDLQDRKNRYLKKALKQAYKILNTYLLGHSRKNELYIAKFIPFFEEQMGVGLGAAAMLTELVRDNRKIVDRFSKEQIDRVSTASGGLLNTLWGSAVERPSARQKAGKPSAVLTRDCPADR